MCQIAMVETVGVRAASTLTLNSGNHIVEIKLASV